MISLKNYIKSIVIKYKTKINVDTDFYDDVFYVSDMEDDDDCMILLFK